MVSAYRLRWRDDASGYVTHFAGKWASSPTADRAWLEEIKRQAVNGDHLEIVEVEQ